jgi:hypothetical protein
LAAAFGNQGVPNTVVILGRGLTMSSPATRFVDRKYQFLQQVIERTCFCPSPSDDALWSVPASALFRHRQGLIEILDDVGGILETD